MSSLAAAALLAAAFLSPAQLHGQWRSGFNANQLTSWPNSVSDPIVLPFNTNIRGSLEEQIYFGNTVFVCNDGLVSFGQLAAYCPQEVDWLSYPASTLVTGALTALAPLHANYGTTPSSGSAGLGWGVGTVDSRLAWGASWDGVNTWGSTTFSSFQLILIDRSDRAPGDFDVEFNYASLGISFNDPNIAFAGAYDIGGFLDPDGNPYEAYTYAVAPVPNSRITMCWVGGTVNNDGCDGGTVGPHPPAVPEPAAWSLVAAGLGGLVLTGRRRRRA